MMNKIFALNFEDTNDKYEDKNRQRFNVILFRQFQYHTDIKDIFSCIDINQG